MPDMKDLAQLPGAHYGTINEKEPDEDSPLPEVDDIDYDDDQQHGEVDPHLVEMLGFNPRDLEDEEEDEIVPVKNKDGSISNRKKK